MLTSDLVRLPTSAVTTRRGSVSYGSRLQRLAAAWNLATVVWPRDPVSGWSVVWRTADLTGHRGRIALERRLVAACCQLVGFVDRPLYEIA